MPTNSLKSADEGGTTFENTLLDCVACGILVIDSDGKILALTADAERALRLAPGQKQTLTLSRLPLPVQSAVREAQATGQSGEHQVVLHSNAAGAVTLSVSVLPLTLQNQTATVVTLKDLSVSGTLERNVRQLDRLASIGTLSASMAHEIKNALVAIKTFIEMQLDHKQAAKQTAEMGGIVRREMSRVDSIVTHMLKFAAPAQPAFAAVRLHEILDHSLRLVQHRTGNKMISFNREFGATSDTIRGDDHQLEQAFVNLLFNAVEAIGPEGTLTISTELVADDTQFELREGPATSRMLRVKITDTGTGIAPEDQKHIFEPFFTTKQTGTGLGLAVTRRIVAEHDGTIEVESQLGKGTTFTVLLPSK